MQDEEKIRNGFVHFQRFRARRLGYTDLEPFHDELFEFLEDPHPRKLVLVPRGSFKSSLITVNYTVGRALADRNVRILIDSEVYRNSVRHLSEVKQHLTMNPLVSQLFGDVRTDPGWREESVILSGRTRPQREPTIDTMGLDVTKVGMHYDVIIPDDLVSDINTQTPEARDKAWNHFQYLFSILEPDGTIIVVGTRWHLDDIYGRIKKDAEKLDFKIFERSAIANDGTLLMPKRLNRDFLDQQRLIMGPYKFSANYQNNPIPDERRTFVPYWIHDNYWKERRKDEKCIRITTIDPAIEVDKRKNDYTAIVTCDHNKLGDIYTVDPRHGHWPVEKTVEEICNVVIKLKPDRLGIEEVAFQKALRVWVEREFKRRRIRCPIYPLKTSNVSKEMRIERLQPVAARGQLHLHQSHYDLEREMLDWPEGRNDDLLDALAYQLDLSPIVRYPIKAEPASWEDRFLRDLQRPEGKKKLKNHMEI